jgi:hypothetical protein
MKRCHRRYIPNHAKYPVRLLCDSSPKRQFHGLYQLFKQTDWAFTINSADFGIGKTHLLARFLKNRGYNAA